jgi:hypothetical protein
MVRLQIQLEPAQHRQVKRRARRLGISVSEVIRRCVGAHLQDEDAGGLDTRGQRALAVAGKYADPHGASHVARNHDAALSDAYRR